MSGPLLGLPAAVDAVYKGLNNFTLLSHFAWAGKAYPFAGASDVTISSNTTWDRVSHPQGFAKVKKLTINASRTLTIRQSPFIIFADEIAGGGAGAIIDASGPDGAASGDFTCGQARGGTAVSGSARAQGGCGGGFLIILCNKFSGTAITIKANGGNGYANTTNAGTGVGRGGQGALSNTIDNSDDKPEQWDGSAVFSTSTKIYLHPIGLWLGNGGHVSGPTVQATGGGCGRGGTTPASGCGGSGIGGGGGYQMAGQLPKVPLTPLMLLELFRFGCRGGGGGGAVVQTTGSNNYATGGGGGAILVYANDVDSVTPSMEANGGIGGGNASNTADGAAGVTCYINLAV